MPKEPRQGPAVLGRVHQRFAHGPAGRFSCSSLSSLHTRVDLSLYPNLLHLGYFTLPTFGALAAVGLIAGLTLSLRTAAKVGLDPEKVWSAGLFTILAAFVLSRFLLVVTNLRDFLTYPILLLMVPSLTAAGLFLTAIATALYLRFRRLPILRTLDAWAPCATLVWAFLALGHFAEGSDPGLPTTPPLGHRHPAFRAQTPPSSPLRRHRRDPHHPRPPPLPLPAPPRRRHHSPPPWSPPE